MTNESGSQTKKLSKADLIVPEWAHRIC
jgi:hypothetical protein